MISFPHAEHLEGFTEETEGTEGGGFTLGSSAMEGVSGTVTAGDSFPPNWRRAASSLVHFAPQRAPLVAGAVAE